MFGSSTQRMRGIFRQNLLYSFAIKEAYTKSFFLVFSVFFSLFAQLKKPEKESQKLTIDEISHLQIHFSIISNKKTSRLKGHRIH